MIELENYLKVGKDGVREITDNMAGYTNACTSFAETTMENAIARSKAILIIRFIFIPRYVFS